MTGILNAGTVFILGAMHALEPGHGKTVIAGYTLGNKYAKSHLLTLVLSMAFSHTIMLLVIGTIILFLFPLFDSERAECIIGMASSAILISIGVYMLYKIKHKSHVCSGSCAHHNKTNPQVLPSASEIKYLKFNVKQNVIHTRRTTALIGFLSGVIPCPTAIAAFFIAGQVGKPANLVWYILLYILGFTLVMLLLAFVFTVIGVKLHTVKSNFKILEKLDHISAWLIIIAGMVYLIYNSFFHLHS